MHSEQVHKCDRNVWISGDKLNVEKVFGDAPPLEISALHVLQIAVRGSFSDILKYIHTADIFLQTSTCRSRFLFASSQHFGRFVSVIKVFRPKIFGGRIFGASLLSRLQNIKYGGYLDKSGGRNKNLCHYLIFVIKNKNRYTLQIHIIYK